MKIPGLDPDTLPFDLGNNQTVDDDDPKAFQLPKSIYEKAPDPAKEEILEDLIGDDSAKALKWLATNHGVGPITLLRQKMYVALERGEFNCELEEGEQLTAALKRNGEDNDTKKPTNKKIMAIIGQPNFGILFHTAKALNMKNQEALRRGVARLLDTPSVIARLQDSERAQAELVKTKNAKYALNTILQQQ